MAVQGGLTLNALGLGEGTMTTNGRDGEGDRSCHESSVREGV